MLMALLYDLLLYLSFIIGITTDFTLSFGLIFIQKYFLL